MMDWKRFGKNQSWPNRGTVQTFSCIEWQILRETYECSRCLGSGSVRDRAGRHTMQAIDPYWIENKIRHVYTVTNPKHD
jgi:hypothetical protein